MTLRHTRPDFGVPPSVFSSPGSSQDVIEALTRIGAIGTWLRGGKVLYATSWEDGPGGWTSLIPSSVGVDRSRSFHGATSWRLTPPPAGTSSTSYKKFPLIHHSRYGLEVLVSMDAAATGFSIALFFYSALYSVSPKFEVRYDQPSGSFSYLNGLNGYTAFATGLPDLRTLDTIPSWFLLKFIVSAEPGAFGYHALVLNDQIFDMRSLPYFQAPQTTQPRLTAQLMAFDTSLGQHPTYFDCFLLTTDEPLYVT